MRLLLSCLLMLLFVTGLAACGKKPSELDAPGNIDPTLESSAEKDAKSKGGSPFGQRQKRVKDGYPAAYPKPWL